MTVEFVLHMLINTVSIANFSSMHSRKGIYTTTNPEFVERDRFEVLFGISQKHHGDF